MGYAIYVAEKLVEIRNLKINEILDIKNEISIDYTSYFLGGVDKEHGSKLPKFLNWYDNRKFIKIWETEEKAQKFLDFLLERANKNYMTHKDPFLHLQKTKGDWKNYYFIVINLNYENQFNRINDSTIIN